MKLGEIGEDKETFVYIVPVGAAIIILLLLLLSVASVNNTHTEAIFSTNAIMCMIYDICVYSAARLSSTISLRGLLKLHHRHTKKLLFEKTGGIR